MKEKIKLIKGEKESISNVELTKSNLLNLIQVDYDDVFIMKKKCFRTY